MKERIDHANSSKVGLATSVIYSLPQITAACIMAPVAIVQGVYAKHYGLALTAIATVVLIARIFDAITDPIIGYCSDRYRAKTATRKPFIWIGGLLFIVSSYFFYVPPEQLSIIYFMGWFFLFYLGWTVFEIPHLAWASELAGTSQEKTKIYSVRNIAGYLGLALFYAVPLLPFFESSEITPETLKWSAIVAGLVMLPLLYSCVKMVPDACGSLNRAEKIPAGLGLLNRKQLACTLLETIFQNKPFLLFLGAYIFFGIGSGMWYGLIFIYVDSYLGLGDQFSGMFLIAFIIGIAATPIWYKVTNWLGKKMTWILAVIPVLFSMIYTGTLISGAASFHDLLIIKILHTLGLTCLGIVVPSALADISDYGTWKFGTNQGATYFSVFTLVAKVNVSLGIALGLAIAGLSGFDAAANAHSEASVFGLRLSISWLPVLLILVSLVFTAFFPITAHRHEIIRRRLEARAKRVEEKEADSALDIEMSPDFYTLLSPGLKK